MLLIASSDPFARPADTTAYASGDLVANSTTPGSVVVPTMNLGGKPNAGSSPAPRVGKVRRVKLKKSGTSVTNASFRLHFYRSAPTVTNGDNGVWLSTESSYLGSFDVTVDKAFSDGAAGVGVPLSGNEMIFAPVDPTRPRIFVLIEARGAYTPVSAEVFTVSAEVETLDNPLLVTS